MDGNEKIHRIVSPTVWQTVLPHLDWTLPRNHNDLLLACAEVNIDVQVESLHDQNAKLRRWSVILSDASAYNVASAIEAAPHFALCTALERYYDKKREDSPSD